MSTRVENYSLAAALPVSIARFISDVLSSRSFFNFTSSVY